MRRPPRVITDYTGIDPAVEKPDIIIQAELTLEESQLVERGLRRLYDPHLALPAATAIGNLISLFTQANERAEGM
jgi:hypothetical protein